MFMYYMFCFTDIVYRAHSVIIFVLFLDFNFIICVSVYVFS